MQGYNIIAKGEYTQAKSVLPVNVSNYVLMEEKGARFLMLKFANDREERVSRLCFTLIQQNEMRRTISTTEMVFDKVDGAPSADFVLNEKIALLSGCEHFTVEMTSVDYGNYHYAVENGELSIEYVKPVAKNVRETARLKAGLRGKKTRITTKRFKAPVAIGVFALISLGLVAAGTVIQLEQFKKTEVEFKYEDIEYRFVDGVNTEDGDIIVTGYKGNAKELIIPDMLEAHEVVAVESGAFSGNAKISRVTFESEIVVGERAFEGCTALKTVNFDKVVSVGEYAFYNTGITEVSSSVLTQVGEGAFANCPSLATVTLNPEEALVLGGYTFKDCPALAQVRMETFVDYQGGQIFDGCLGIASMYLQSFNYDGYGSRESYVLEDLFGRIGVVSLEIDSLATMPAGFAEGLSIEGFRANNLPQNDIPDRAFMDCATLKTLYLPNHITSVGEHAFSGTSLKSYDVSTLTSIGDYAFSGSGLVALALDNTSENFTLGEGVFSDCKSLKTVSISYPFKSVYEGLFKGCSALQSVEFAQTAQPLTIESEAFYGCSSLTDILIPASVVTIESEAFYGCRALSSITVPNTVMNMGAGVFSGCTGLQTLSIPFTGDGAGDSTRLGHIFSTRTTNNSAVPSSLKEVILTGNRPVSSRAFLDMESLERIEMAGEISAIEQEAFSSCTSLKEIVFSKTLTQIDDYAFQGCTALERVDVPNGVTAMGPCVFWNCSSLKEMRLPFVGNGSATRTNLGYIFNGATVNDLEEIPQTLTKITLTGSDNASRYVLGSSAFAECKYLQSVVIEGGVTRIGSSAFSGCDSLKEVLLPSTLQTVESEAFYGCNKLRTLHFAEGLQTIGRQAFFECYRLQNITLPSTLVSLSDTAFESCYNLYEIQNLSQISLSIDGLLNVYVEEEDKMPTVTADGFTFSLAGKGTASESWYLTSYPEKTEMVLPESFEVKGAEVNRYRIPKGLFYYEQGIVSVTMPKAVQSVGAMAFGVCANLQWVDLQATAVTEIPDSCFASCVSLIKVEVPSGLERIGDSAFNYCEGLQAIRLPAMMQTIGEYAFYGCKELYIVSNDSALPIVKGSTDYGYVAQYALVVDRHSEWMQRIIENDVQYVRDGDLWYVVDIPSEMTELKLADFTRNGVLASNFCLLPAAFERTDGSELALTSLQTKISGSLYVPAYALMGAKSLSTLSLGCDNLIVEDYSFANNFYLQSVTINATGDCCVTATTFANDYSLSTLSITAYNCDIKDYAFRSHSSLQSLTVNATNYTVGEEAFYNCYNLSEVTLQKGTRVANIGVKAFAYCQSLQTLSLAGVQEIKEETFANCSNLQSVSLPTTLKTIGANAFRGIYARELTIPKGVTAIGDYAFAENGSLISISLPSTLKTIGNYAFYNDYSLQQLTVSSGVTTIGEYAFAYNTSLNKLSLPTTLQSIGAYAFHSCNSLTSLTLPKGLKVIGDEAFARNGSLQSVTVPATLTSMGDGVFRDCGGLTDVTLTNGLIRISNYAFQNCYNLAVITIPRSMQTIESEAFAYCTRLYEVYNLSSYITLTEGVDTNGAARYALAIYTSETEERRVYINEQGSIFVKQKPASGGKWYLHRANISSDLYKMPTSFVAPSGAKVSSYGIGAYAFEGHSVSRIVIPTNVSFIQADAFSDTYSLYRLYYAGSQSKWNSLTASVSVPASVYFKVDCVHGDDEWTYDEYENVVDGISSSSATTKQPTCYAVGAGKVYCTVCGEYVFETYTIEKTNHTFGEDGKCTAVGCKATGTVLTKDTYLEMGFSNPEGEENPFVFDEKGLHSTNKEDRSSSTIVFTASEAMTVNIQLSTSCEGADSFYVIRNGYTTEVHLSGEGNSITLQIILGAGDTLSFTYSKDGSVSVGDDCAYIKQFVILD